MPEFLFSHHVLSSIAFTLLHSLWQAALIAVVLFLALRWIKPDRAQLRYRLGTIALCAPLLCAGLTFSYYFHTSECVASTQSVGCETVIVADAPVTLITLTAPNATTASLEFSEWIAPHLPTLIALYLIGLCLFATRFAGSLLYVEALRYSARPLGEYDRHWSFRLTELANQLGANRHIGLANSRRVKTPVLIGYFKPLILFPVGAINALPAEEVEAILHHELAHVLRRDYLMNLLQSLIEVLFYFNPAVWWMSAIVRREREYCCDDLAIQSNCDPITYAYALVHVQEMATSGHRLALGFARQRQPELLRRVRRILQQPNSTSNLMEKLFIASLLLTFVLLVSFRQSDNFGENDSDRASFLTTRVTHLDRFVQSLPDTLPSPPIRENRTRINISDDNGNQYFMETEDGEITTLRKNGKPVEGAERETVLEEINTYERNRPVPPTPPSPPAVPGAPPAPPSPPSPPTPLNGDGKVQVWKWVDGNYVLEQEDIFGPEGFQFDIGEDFDFGFEMMDPGEWNMNDLVLDFDPEDDFLFLSLDSLPESEHRIRIIELRQELDEMRAVQREELQRQREELRARQQEMREHQRLLNDEMRVLMEERRIAMREATDAEREAHRLRWEAEGLPHLEQTIIVEQRHGHNPSEELKVVLLHELENDNYVDEDGNFSIELQSDRIKINGERMGKSVLEKYTTLYQEIMEEPLKGRLKYTVKKRGTNTSTSFSLAQ